MPSDLDRLDADLRLCVCGCAQSEHGADGRCAYCGPDQCAGFAFDADGSLDALMESDVDIDLSEEDDGGFDA